MPLSIGRGGPLGASTNVNEKISRLPSRGLGGWRQLEGRRVSDVTGSVCRRAQTVAANGLMTEGRSRRRSASPHSTPIVDRADVQP
jgi:hypothetical protein